MTLHFILLALKYFLIFILCVAAFAFITDRTVRSRGWHGPVTDHFDGEHFHNIGVEQSHRASSAGFWKWVLNRPPNTWVRRENVRSAKPAERVEGATLTVTMVGHASLLIQTEGINILTDPIWSKRASPFSFLGPKRYRDPGIAFEDLPPIDVVVISHNHYDHMDIPTLKRLAEKSSPIVFVPLGNKAYLEERGITRVTELDWWGREEISVGSTITAVPAQHFSSRAFSDRNTTLWGGYIIGTPHGNLYFAGDTGYGPFIEKIKERYPSFRLAMIPIGAFKPEFFMSPVHVSPEEGLRMAHDLSASVMIPVHYGTFHLADDQQDEPVEALKEAIKTASSTIDVRILSSGEETSL